LGNFSTNILPIAGSQLGTGAPWENQILSVLGLPVYADKKSSGRKVLKRSSTNTKREVLQRPQP